MNVSTGDIINVFYDLLISSYTTIYKYGHPANYTGEFLVLNYIPNTRDRIKTGSSTKFSNGYGFAYVTAFIPKINNGVDYFVNSSRINTVQNDIINLIDSFSTTTKVNSMVMYADTEPIIANDLKTHSKIIFRVTVNYS